MKRVLYGARDVYKLTKWSNDLQIKVIFLSLGMIVVLWYIYICVDIYVNNW